MAITDELREWMAGLYTPNSGTVKMEGERIADRIDTAHRAALEKLAAQVDTTEPDCAEDKAEPETGVNWKEEARTWERRCKELIVERDERYIELPVDKDGVPWHVGDVTENGNTVNGMTIDRNGWFFTNTVNDIDPSIHCHRAQTVENVLREFAERVCNSGHQWGLDAADTIAEFASKLRMAEEVDA